MTEAIQKQISACSNAKNPCTLVNVNGIKRLYSKCSNERVTLDGFLVSLFFTLLIENHLSR